MKALDDIQTLLDAMKDRRGELAAFEDLLSEVSTALADIVLLMSGERKDNGCAAIADAIKALAIPAPTVTVQAPNVTVEAPRVEPIINVHPASVVFPAETRRYPTGLRVSKRDENGSIKDLTILWSE